MSNAPKHPYIFAHRGFHLECRENTLSAFRAAADVGAHGIELDIRLSRDGELVVYHDATIKTRVITRRLRVRDLHFDELQAIGRSEFGEAIPSLKQVLDTFKGAFQFINIEFKDQGTRVANTRLVKTVQELFKSYDQEPFIVTSFHPYLVRWMKDWHRDLRAGFLLQPLTITAPFWKFWLDFSRADFYHPRYDWFFNWKGPQALPKPVSTWTLDNLDLYGQRIIEAANVFGVITNRPDLWLKGINSSSIPKSPPAKTPDSPPHSS